jgi:uncharacterized protein YndB with AHSA1/START domain
MTCFRRRISVTTDSTVFAKVTHRFTASAERVFDAWLDPGLVHRWWSGMDDIVRIEIDPRVGGEYSFVVHRDGQDLDHHGEYLEIDRPGRLVFTWLVDDEEGPSVVTIDITPTGTGCELNLVHEMDARWADYISLTENGWSTISAAIATVVE